jgi:hypothetical protein
VVCHGPFEDPAYDVVDKTSCVIDLAQGVEAIVASFNSTSRNEYRRALRAEELELSRGTDDLEAFYEFYAACEHERAWRPAPPSEIEQSLLFSARFEGELISGMSCYGDGERLRVGRIFSSKRAKRSERLTNTVYGGASKAIVADICAFGIEHGCTSLDLGGIDAGDGAKSGITQFKLSLGGVPTPVRVGRWMNDAFRAALPEIERLGMDVT